MEGCCLLIGIIVEMMKGKKIKGVQLPRSFGRTAAERIGAVDGFKKDRILLELNLQTAFAKLCCAVPLFSSSPLFIFTTNSLSNSNKIPRPH